MEFVDFIINPVAVYKKARAASHAFDGMRNLSDAVLSAWDKETNYFKKIILASKAFYEQLGGTPQERAAKMLFLSSVATAVAFGVLTHPQVWDHLGTPVGAMVLSAKGSVCTLNCGGEGEYPGGPGELVINVNHKQVLRDGFKAARDGQTTLGDIRSSGQHVVIAEGDRLPFASRSADKVITNGSPVGKHRTWLGAAYDPDEMKRVSKK